jgi:Tol biopolymer transport system component
MVLTALQRGLLVGLLAALTLPAVTQAQVNGQIVFERGGCFWTMDADGSNQTQIGNQFAADFCPGNNRHPVWSPDGTKIAFTSDFHTTRPSNIYVMNADGTNVVWLNDALADYDPAWSPDGAQIAFRSNRDGNVSSIYAINVDGTGLHRITSAAPASDEEPTWSPDGTQIAFHTNEMGVGIHIALIGADGGGRTDFRPDYVLGFDPAWSPDGTRIAYEGYDGTIPQQIYVMYPDGTQRTRLTYNTFIDLKPAWSPDSTMIAFERNISGHTHIFVMQADGTGQVDLTGPDGGEAPDWQNLPAPATARSSQ